MEREVLREIERYGYNETILDTNALLFVLLMGVLLLLLPRRYALVPLIATACFITEIQRIVIAGLDFDMLRILIVFGCLRVLLRSEYRLIQFNVIDKTVLWYAFCGIITYTILWQTGSAFINRTGWAYNILGMYFLTRIFLKDTADIVNAVKALVLICIPLAIVMIYEQIDGRNYFSYLGGVPEFTVEREGRLRSQGSFSHPILAGSLGASLMPLAIGLWFKNRNFILALIGACVSTIITFTTASSGPVLAYLAGFFALFLWSLRRYMRYILWGLIIALIGLQFVMNAPIWALIMRISVVGGSTGYHRYALIDATVRNFREWFLVGVRSTGHWGWGLQDVTNMYVRVAIDGGLIGLVLFVSIIILAFRALWRVICSAENNKAQQKFLWAIGAALFTHVVSFYGVSYFSGQIIFFWYMSIAFISSIGYLEINSIKNARTLGHYS